MKRTHSSCSSVILRALIATALLLGSNLAAAQQAYPYYPGYSPYSYGKPAQPQQQPSYAYPPGYSQRQPAYSTQPANPYGQQPGATRSHSTPPVTTARISSRNGYVQQTLVLTLEVSSNSSISTLSTELPKNSKVIYKLLDGPTSTTSSNNKQKQVHRYRFAITPIEAGNISLQPIRIKGSFSGGNTGSDDFDITRTTPIELDIRPIENSVQPWLPLHGQLIQAVVQNHEKPAAGKPLTLIIDISAVGATGSQLPSLERQLKQSDFRVYREKSEAKGSISKDGQHLLGYRTEIFTLVPLRGGKVQIPELNIDWWNVDTHQKEHSSIPIRQLLVKGEKGESNSQEIDDLFPGASSLILWVPLIGVFAVTFGFWMLAWARKRRFIQVVEEEIAAIVFHAFLRITAFLTWLAPIRRLQRLRQLLIGNLPRPFRLWFCIRLVSGEDDPETWAYMLRFLTNKHLGIPTQLPLVELGRRLAGAHPLSSEERLEELMQMLDAALYNGSQIDFSLWKRRFRRELRPSLVRWKHKSASGRKQLERLPPLNPGS